VEVSESLVGLQNSRFSDVLIEKHGALRKTKLKSYCSIGNGLGAIGIRLKVIGHSHSSFVCFVVETY
jgi:hypothetical protein